MPQPRFAPVRRIPASFWALPDRLPRRLGEVVAECRRHARGLAGVVSAGEPLGPSFAALRDRARAEGGLAPVLPLALAHGVLAAERLLGDRWPVLGDELVWGLNPRDAQIACAAVMAQGDVAELDTGEGKTLCAALAAACWALVGRVHLVTANDYLARRDVEWMGPLLRSLGLTVGAIEHATLHEARQRAYQADVTYASVKELGADYLRDTLTADRQALLIPALETAILDEVDFILVDEARIPLILAQQVDPLAGGQGLCHQFNRAIAEMVALQERVKARLERELDEIPSQAAWSAKKRRFEATVRLAALMLADPLDPRLERRLAEAVEAGDGAVVRRVRDTILRFERGRHREELLDDMLFTVDRRSHTVQMTERGLDHLIETFGDLFAPVASAGGPGDGVEPDEALEAHRARVRAVHNLIAAHVLYRRDRDYIVDEGKVVLIDQPTGRPSFDRHLQHGLHRALEAKEGLYPALDHQTAAEITFPGLFQLYERFCGTSGTALELGPELRRTSRKGVVRVPPHQRVVRADLEDVLFRTAEEKVAALVSEVLLARELRQPVLVGTASVEQSEWVSDRLAAAGVDHEVLNARHHEREARIIARAGEPGAVTVATAMAGRGTDIRPPPDLDRQIAEAAAAWIAGRLGRGEARGARLELFTPAERDLVVESLRRRGLEPRGARGRAGGELVDVGPEPPPTAFPLSLGPRVIGFERLGASRLDRQLRGRTGRQGGPGSTRFYLSLDDETVLIHADRARLAELRRGSRRLVDPLSGHVVRSSSRLLGEVWRAWRTAEALADRQRARLDRLDAVDQAQRSHYERERRALLFASDEVVDALADQAIARAAREVVLEVAGPGTTHVDPALEPALDDLAQVLFERRGLLGPLLAAGEAPGLDRAAEALAAALSRFFAVARASYGPEMAQVERTVLLDSLTEVWRLLAVERPELREQAELYAYANRKPDDVYRALAGRAYQRALAAAARTAASVLVTFPLPREVKTPRTGLPVEEPAVLALFGNL